MNIEELYKKLSYGELSNLSMSGEGNGTIIESARPKIILYANDALTRLHSRFPLREKDVLIEMHEHITNYHLLPRFAKHHTPVEEKVTYILDMPLEPFTDEVIRILSVYDTYGCRLPLNNDAEPNSVFTPQAKVLQVPRPIAGSALNVAYQTKHDVLDHEKMDQPIFIPDTLESALTAYIAYKVYSHINTAEATNKAQEHLAFYESVCGEVVEHDLVSSTVSTTNQRFEKRGWI
jgi:hypothetical protein